MAESRRGVRALIPVLLWYLLRMKDIWDEAVREKIAATRENYTLCSAKVYEEFSTTEDD